MDFQSFKQAVIARCAQKGIEEYELYYQTAESTSVSVFQHSVNEFTGSIEGGVCLRCIVGGRMGYASTEALNEEQAASIVDRAADNAVTLESDEPVFLAEGGLSYAPITVAPYALPDTESLIAKALDTQEKLYASDPAVVDGTETQGICESSETFIYNSKGLDLHSRNTLSGLVVGSVVTDGKEMANSYEIKLGELTSIDTDALAAKATAEAKQKLGGEVAPTGQYPVVFAPSAMCSLLGVFSAIFSGENAQKGLSKLAGKEGEVIAAPIVTLVDDPFFPGSTRQRSFDAEGMPTFTKNVIEGGVFKTLLYNMKTAAVAGKKTTGNASKAGYDAPVAVRPFTMYLVPGERSEEELLAPIEKGVYITSLGGLHAGANPITGDFSLQSSGFMIEDGNKTTFVKSFTVAGNFYGLLKNITEIGRDLETPGMGAFGSPAVRVDGLSIAGK